MGGRSSASGTKDRTPHTHGLTVDGHNGDPVRAMHSANGSWGYSAGDTGFALASRQRRSSAWEIDANDADLDMISAYIARDGYLFWWVTRGKPRFAIGYDASYSSPRELCGASTSTTRPAYTGGTGTSSSAIH